MNISALSEEFKKTLLKAQEENNKIKSILEDLATLKREKSELEIKKKRKEIEALKDVAFDSSLKNERQRESILNDNLYKDVEYLNIILELPFLEEKIKMLEASLEYHKNNFSLQKRILDYITFQLNLLKEA